MTTTRSFLRWFFDEDGTAEITDGSPDYIRDAATDGTDLVEVKEIYLKSIDPLLEYEEVSVTTVGDEDGASKSGEVDITYSLDGNTYHQILSLPDGTYEIPLKVYRKAVAPAVDYPMKRPWEEDGQIRGLIEHEVHYHAYRR